MTRVFVPAALLAAAAASAQAPQVRLVIKSAGQISGSVTVSQRLLPDGKKLVAMTTSMTSETKRTVTVLQESVYSPSGRPVRMLQRTSIKGSGTVLLVQADFGAKNVQVSIETGGRKESNLAPYPQGSVDAKNEFWLLRDKPAPGTKHVYSRFDIGTRSWIPTTAVFVGPAKASVGSRQVPAFLVTLNGIKTFCDSQGLPLRMESPSLLLERAP
jgi:hypothetical protein